MGTTVATNARCSNARGARCWSSSRAASVTSSALATGATETLRPQDRAARHALRVGGRSGRARRPPRVILVTPGLSEELRRADLAAAAQ